jgi:accessory gene regulator protein AgrB
MMVCSSTIVKLESALYAPVYRREAALVKSGSEEHRKRKKKARNSSSNSRKLK